MPIMSSQTTRNSTADRKTQQGTKSIFSDAAPGNKTPSGSGAQVPNPKIDGATRPGIYLCQKPRTTPDASEGDVLLEAPCDFKVIHQSGAWLKVRIYPKFGSGVQTGFIRRLDTDLVHQESDRLAAQNEGARHGIRGNADSAATELARYNPNESLIDNIMRATPAVETGGSFERMGDIGDGAGISVGGFQYTEKSSLATLVKQYQSMGGKVQFGSENVKLLESAMSKNGPALTYAKREEIMELLQRAYNTDYECYVAAQKLTWMIHYFKPCTDRMFRYGLTPTGPIDEIPSTYDADTSKLLDPKISILIYDHENSGAANNNKLMEILLGRYPLGDGRIDQSKLTLENVAAAVQDQFAQASNYGTYEKGWNNRVMGLYCAMKLSDSSVKPEESSTDFSKYAAKRPPEFRAFRVGTKVKIAGTHYATGSKIPEWAKTKVYEIASIGFDTAILSEINSKFWLKDLRMEDGSMPEVPENDVGNDVESAPPVSAQTPSEAPSVSAQTPSEAPSVSAQTPSEAPPVSAQTPSAAPEAGHTENAQASIVPGAKVRITGSHYSTGQHIPGWVKERQLTVSKVIGGRALIEEIVSWVNIGDLSAADVKEFRPAAKPAEKSVTEEAGTSAEPESGVKADSKDEAGQSDTKLTAIQKLLKEHPEIVTNQDLINYLFSLGGDFNGAAAAGKSKFNVDINVLCGNRKAPVSESAVIPDIKVMPTGKYGLNSNEKLRDNAVQVEKEMEGSGYCATAVSRAISRTYGINVRGNGNTIGKNLPADTFRAVDAPLAEALKVPGIVLTWQWTEYGEGDKYGHAAISIGDGVTSVSDYSDKYTLTNKFHDFQAYTTY